MTSDPRPPRQIRDLDLLKELHIQWRGDCVLAELGECREDRYSLHHIHKHPRDDVEANVVMLCGDGTTGHHGLIEAHNHLVCRALARYLMTERLDTMYYLGRKLGGVNAVRAWLNSQLHAGL